MEDEDEKPESIELTSSIIYVKSRLGKFARLLFTPS